MHASTILVNQDYQRSDKVWPQAARSYLIETILLGYPMPKLSLYQTTNLKTRTTKKEIVDGQQRSRAIFDFFYDKLRLSGKSHYAGKLFSQLEEEERQRFVEYQITVDLFVGATPHEIRQVFRRMNSYTVPLNPPEKRHATFQGKLKWFIVEMSEQYSDTIKNMGVYSEKQLSRMADSAMLADIAYTLHKGILSASEASIEKFYEAQDKEFPTEDATRVRIERSMDTLIGWPELHNTTLCRPYNFYSLITAITHALAPAAPLNSVFAREGPARIDPQIAVSNLAMLADALERPTSYKFAQPFIEACAKATNRIDPRKTRFVWFSRALDPTPLQ